MEQKSNVQYRAEKLYKNSREKFYFLLREILSNSIQAVLIRKEKEKGRRSYAPELTLEVSLTEKLCEITLRDNGEGFTSVNSKCFDELDKRNEEKEKFHFHPLGQGRLSIVYFTNSANYETVYESETGELKKKCFPYPKEEEGLFNLCDFLEDATDVKDTYTILKIVINKQQQLNRAKTFFRRYESVSELKQWLIETFFPVIVANDDLKVNLVYNNETATVSLKDIETETQKEDFRLSPDGEGQYDFRLWLIKNNTCLRGDNTIVCFARNLRAELANGKLTYTIDSQEGYLLYLTSEFFDEFVDTKGESIEVSSEAVTAINEKINELLDARFKETIKHNQKETESNLKSFRNRFPSLVAFVPEDAFEDSKKVVDEEDFVKTAIETKGRYEKRFWSKISKPDSDADDVPYDESEECQKLLNSSLHIYVKHRERVLQRLRDLIRKFDEEGNIKPELEKTVHELFFRRGETLSQSENINHLHNLWILDDKFTTFSDSFRAKSTQNGQKLSDIYIWADDMEEIKQLLILELKSTTKAHNAGDKEKGMIAQVKEYAKDVYNNPVNTLNWDVDTKSIQFMGIILSRKSDINKELTSSSVNGTYEAIPFLKDSFYKDDYFNPTGNPRDKVPIRIELYSFEDIYKLASSRNDVFFKLLRNGFVVKEHE